MKSKFSNMSKIFIFLYSLLNLPNHFFLFFSDPGQNISNVTSTTGRSDESSSGVNTSSFVSSLGEEREERESEWSAETKDLEDILKKAEEETNRDAHLALLQIQNDKQLQEEIKRITAESND